MSMPADYERRAGREEGLTLVEVLVALFILSVGVIGVLATIPVGVDTAQTIIVQDNAVTLSQSKLGEFRRDRIVPGEPGLAGYHAFMKANYDLRKGNGSYATNICWPSCDNTYYKWHKFECGEEDAYTNFADIEEYEWRIVGSKHVAIEKVAIEGSGGPGDIYYVPRLTATLANFNSSIGLYRINIEVRKIKTTKVFDFDTYMTSYD